MRYPRTKLVLLSYVSALTVLSALCGGCGDEDEESDSSGAAGNSSAASVPSGSGGANTSGGSGQTSSSSSSSTGGKSTTSVSTLPAPPDGIPFGNPDGKCAVPKGAGPDTIDTPTKVVGDGTAASCTGAAVVAAVWNDGKPVNKVTFNCGADPITITLSESIKVPNAPEGAVTIIDGGGKVTLSGGGKVRILYSNACNNKLGWYTSHCDNQDSPHVTVQNLTFIDGNAANNAHNDVDEPSGGAIFMRSGRLKIVNCRFFNNHAINAASDYGGGAVRVLGQYNSEPVYVTNSTFGGGEKLGNSAANGGALSSIGTTWTITNSLFSYNTAVGTGANSGNGGNGGAIYNDGNLFTLTVCGAKMDHNVANEGGSAIFFVSNDRSGSISILDSKLSDNPKKGFGDDGLFILAKTGSPVTTGSTIE